MSYLGLDQSFGGFGISALTDDGHTTKVVRFPPAKFGNGVDRLKAIGDFLVEYLAQLDRVTPIRHVCMEGYARGRPVGREEAGELAAVVKLALRSTLGDPVCYPTVIAPTSLKKFATGSGSSQKNQIMLAVYKKWGVEFSDDNAADAYVLARIARAMVHGADLDYEQKVADVVRGHTENPALTQKR